MLNKQGNFYTFFFATVVCVVCSVLLAIAATALKPAQTVNAQLDVIRNILVVAGYKAAPLTEKDKAAGAKSIYGMKGPEILSIFKRDFKPVLLNKANQEVSRKAVETKLLKLGYPKETVEAFYMFELLDTFEKKKGLLANRAKQKLKDYDPGYKSLFRYQPGGKLDSYIVPIDGPGLWGMMFGYIALKPDLNSVAGITFYKHIETPGLGGEAEKPWFRNNWIDKKIFDKNGKFVSVGVAKGKAKDSYKGDELNHYVDGMSGATITGKGITDFVKADLGQFVQYFKKLRGARDNEPSKQSRMENRNLNKLSNKSSSQTSQKRARAADERKQAVLVPGGNS